MATSLREIARASLLKMLAISSMTCLRIGGPELTGEEYPAARHAPAGPHSEGTFVSSLNRQPSPDRRGDSGDEGEVYLVAVKASELRMDALRWVLMHEVQSGDTVHVHAIVEEIRTDMGSKYRVNELAFHGVRWRKLDAVLELMEQRLKAEVARYEATCRTKDVRLQVKVVAANPAEGALSASAKALGATMLLIDKKLQGVGKACARDPEFADHCAVLLIDGAKCTTIRLASRLMDGAPGEAPSSEPSSPLPMFATRRKSFADARTRSRSTSPAQSCASSRSASQRSSPRESCVRATLGEDRLASQTWARLRTVGEDCALPRDHGEVPQHHQHSCLPIHKSPLKTRASDGARPANSCGTCNGCAHCSDANGGMPRSHNPGEVRSPAAPSGGLLLKTMGQREEGLVMCLQSYLWQELEEATGGFPSCKLLGTGGFGRVYQGVLEDQPVAIKVLKALTPQAETQFDAEVQLLGGLRHPNIVTLLGYCRADTERLLVYKLSPQGSLDQHLYGPKWPLSWDQRAKIVLGLAHGLAYLHSRSIVHCDLRPSNVLLTKDFMPMVADFGLAQHLTKEELVSKCSAMGSFGYMDPEYLCTGMLTPKVDVYAFGVIMLGIVTGTRPFDPNASLEAKTILQLGQSNLRQCTSLAEQLGDKMVDPRLERLYNPREVKQFMQLALQCINHRAAHRPTMADVLEELQRYRKSEVSSLGR